MSTHLNGLLRQQEPIVREDDPRSVQVFHNMFLNAARNMESDKDKQTLALLQRQVVSFLGVSLGISAFEEHGRNLGLDDAVNDDDDDDDDDEKEENKLSWSTAYSHEESHKAGENSSYSAFREAQKKSWTERPEDYDDNKIDIFGPERAERERLRQLSIDDEENREEEEEDDEEDEEDDGEEEVEEVQVKSREINQGGNDGFKVVSRKQKKKKAPRPSYNNNNNNNNYQRNDQRYSRPSNNYYKQSYTRRPAPICSFHPDYLERLSGETFCMPIFFPSEDSYSVSSLFYIIAMCV
jgi:hypothetical protein